MNAEQFEYEWRTFASPGFLIVKVPDSFLKIFKDEVEYISTHRDTATKFNGRLLGQLANEFEFRAGTISKIEPFILRVMEEYEANFTRVYEERTGFGTPYLDTTWVNFQKKHEYNPPHTHSGMYSFALWLNIPYDLGAEHGLDNCKDAYRQGNSNFNFLYTNSLGISTPHPIPVDKTMEGRMVFFPAGLTHYVNPFFTSDEERISVAGNIGLRKA